MTAPHRPPGSPALREESGPRIQRGYLISAALLALAALMWLWPETPDREAAPSVALVEPGASSAPLAGTNVALTAQAASPPGARLPPAALPDSDDLAAHVPPGQTPSMSEVIQRLRQAGVNTGLAAFNPPGTSPPLVGLAVPADFPLPDGFVRHHQTTDDGQDIEPILMFAPDRTFYDSQGRAIELPKDRVVPAEWAPPGMPIRRIVVPPPLPPAKAGS